METFNKFGVGTRDGNIVILMPPRILSPGDAMLFAAWIVAMAGAAYPAVEFGDYIDAVENT